MYQIRALDRLRRNFDIVGDRMADEPMMQFSLTGEPGAPAEQTSSHTTTGKKRHLLAVFLSALIPGTGQLLLRKRNHGIFLLSLFVALLACFWPIRLLRFYWGFLSLYGCWTGLYLYAASAARTGAELPARLSRWWLVAILPVAFVACSLLGAVLTRAAGFRAFEIPSTSMEPTIVPGDHIVTDSLYYHSHRPQRGDLIVFRANGLFIVKRVIALGGDVIQAKERLMLLNGKELDEPYVEHILPEGENPQQDTFGPISVPPNHYFVMGDNRDVSLDSRFPGGYGAISSQSLVGKSLYIFYSEADRTGKGLR
jgi:signal peptidase I